jgi:hypothetical protein
MSMDEKGAPPNPAQPTAFFLTGCYVVALAVRCLVCGAGHVMRYSDIPVSGLGKPFPVTLPLSNPGNSVQREADVSEPS